MRFHLIDRIDAHTPSQSVTARKGTSVSEEFWDETPDGLVMPPPLVLEGLCQAVTWLIVASTERRKRAALLQVGSVAFLDDVRPGDVIEFSAQVASMTDEMAVVSGVAEVEGHKVLEAADIMCALIDASNLEDLDDTARMQRQLLREDAP